MQMRAEKKAIDKIYKRRDRYEIPDWQREVVWAQDKKQLLIDSILRDWNLCSQTIPLKSQTPEGRHIPFFSRRCRS
jgi:hypothetical protein